MTRATPLKSPFSGYGSGSGPWFHFHVSGVALAWIYPFGKGEKTRRGGEVTQGTSSRPSRELPPRAVQDIPGARRGSGGLGRDLPGP